MKKSLLALAVLGSFAAAASAQTSVSIYGIVDAGITYKNDANPAGKTIGLDSGLNSGSRLGFKGSEDLGGGLSAIFTLENGFTVDDGKMAQGNRLFGRQAWVGVNGGFGTVKLGRQLTPLYTALDQVDPFGVNLAGNAQKVFGYGTYAADPLQRTDNTLSYSTPNVSGLTGTVAYGFGEKAGDNSANRNLGLGLGYSNGPLSVQFAYQRSNDFAIPASMDGGVAEKFTAAFIGATYNFGVAKAHVAFAENKLEDAADSMKNRNYLVGVSAPVGVGTVLASYIRNDFKGEDNAASDQYALGYTHPLSKRTNLYTSFSYTKNDADVALNTFNADQDGKSVRLFNVGIRHAF
jgi:predicted porin